MIENRTHQGVRDFLAKEMQNPNMQGMHFVLISRNSKPNVYSISTVGTLADAEVVYCLESMKSHMILNPNQ